MVHVYFAENYLANINFILLADNLANSRCVSIKMSGFLDLLNCSYNNSNSYTVKQ